MIYSIIYAFENANKKFKISRHILGAKCKLQAKFRFKKFCKEIYDKRKIVIISLERRKNELLL